MLEHYRDVAILVAVVVVITVIFLLKGIAFQSLCAIVAVSFFFVIFLNICQSLLVMILYLMFIGFVFLVFWIIHPCLDINVLFVLGMATIFFFMILGLSNCCGKN